MLLNLVTSSKVSITYSGGSTQLLVKNFKASENGSTTIAKAMGIGAAGFVHNRDGLSLSFDHYVVAAPEIDFRKLSRTKEVFALTEEKEGGKAVQFTHCVVSKVDYSADAEGEFMDSVEVMALVQKDL